VVLTQELLFDNGSTQPAAVSEILPHKAVSHARQRTQQPLQRSHLLGVSAAAPLSTSSAGSGFAQRLRLDGCSTDTQHVRTRRDAVARLTRAGDQIDPLGRSDHGARDGLLNFVATLPSRP
jgi:hypothetical protein